MEAIGAGDAEGGVLSDLNVIADAGGVENHSAMMPDPNPTADKHGVGERDAAGPFDPFEKNAIEEREREANEFGKGHTPIAETMKGDRPEALFPDAAVGF